MPAPLSKPPMNSQGTGWPSLCKPRYGGYPHLPGWVPPHQGPDRNFLQSPQDQKKDEEQGDHPYSHRAPQTCFCSLPSKKQIFFLFLFSL